MTNDILSQELGQKLSTKEVGSFLGFDEDTVRKHYRKLGGVRPTGPKGRILFFEMNVVDALRRNYALEDTEGWSSTLEREDSEGREDQAKAVRYEGGSTCLGNRTKKGGLVEDRHDIFSR